LTLTLVVQAWYEYQLKWPGVPQIVREMSGNCQGISWCLESGHPVCRLLAEVSMRHCADYWEI